MTTTAHRDQPDTAAPEDRTETYEQASPATSAADRPHAGHADAAEAPRDPALYGV
ncbi:hypothetical protein ACIRD3_13100 [Kitasatospora sp. NPDC093550]|uniref:hypothetical protein n=1 Tax=Kitasatospora sp. NPDC093550 TaxID=3364089 RepID=UPI0038104BCF